MSIKQMTLPALIDALAAEHGGSRAKLAGASGVSESALSLLYYGKRTRPSLGTLCRLLAATGDIALQAALLEAAGITDALVAGRERVNVL